MENELIEKVRLYIAENIGNFHQNRIENLKKLKLKTVLRRKNPYLFKAKYLLTASDVVRSLTDAFISSAEETIFGDWMESLAIFICKNTYGGWKSSAKGIDLEFDKDNIRYIVSIKSGPKWGNNSQIEKMKADFKLAKKILRTSNSQLIIQAVNGCCYGKESKPDKDDYFKYCGQAFWTFISGQENLYTDIIEPLAANAKERNEEFQKSYAAIINNFTKDFVLLFCNEDGSINWLKLVEFNSGNK